MYQRLLRASCLTLEINEFRCYEAKIEESEKVGSHRESNPGHLYASIILGVIGIEKHKGIYAGIILDQWE